ncbi:hypothetical protein NPIL_588551, partial [Nephila pilipes]
MDHSWKIRALFLAIFGVTTLQQVACSTCGYE